MDHREAGRYWNGNADAWTSLARQGYDVYRDHLNTPWFLRMLPEVAGLRGLDVGCGEGHNTRQVAERGARMTALDISRRFVGHARDFELRNPLGIRYLAGSAVELPFGADTFDFATSFMCMMDVPESAHALAEVFRVLKPGGFFQFSITHPCSDTPYRKNLRDESGRTVAIAIGQYFESTVGRVDSWSFSSAPREEKEKWEPFQVPFFHRTLSEWLNNIASTRFVLERVEEPCPDHETVARCRDVQDSQVAPYFLHLRCRKPRT